MKEIFKVLEDIAGSRGLKSDQQLPDEEKAVGITIIDTADGNEY